MQIRTRFPSDRVLPPTPTIPAKKWFSWPENPQSPPSDNPRPRLDSQQEPGTLQDGWSRPPACLRELLDSIALGHTENSKYKPVFSVLHSPSPITHLCDTPQGFIRRDGSIFPKKTINWKLIFIPYTNPCSIPSKPPLFVQSASVNLTSEINNLKWLRAVGISITISPPKKTKKPCLHANCVPKYLHSEGDRSIMCERLS